MKRAKLYQGAAIALVGWYLMMPPHAGTEYPMGNVNAPLSQWLKRPTKYRDKEECEHVLDRRRRLTNAKNRQVALRYYKQAQCVSEGDPRLKAK